MSGGGESELQRFLEIFLFYFDKTLRMYAYENALNSACENCFEAECKTEDFES